MAKQISLLEAADKIKDGMTIMMGGFLGVGCAHQIIDELVKRGVKNLTIIGNDTAFPDKAHGKLVANHQVKRVVATHIGTNPETINQKNSGEMEVELVPQGTLAECIRAAGAGLGGVLTPTGLGTVVAEGKQIINIDGKDYLLEKPVRADVALIAASVVDESGNCMYKGTTQNFNPIMATAADIVIVEAERLVKTGEIAPEAVHTPNIFIDYIYIAK